MKKLFFNDKSMLFVVLLNVAVIFLQECGLESALLNVTDIACTVLFVVEMILKHFSYGVKGYWRDGWNVLDGVVTIISLPALLTYFTPALSDYSFIIAFRALRVFKLFRTARRRQALLAFAGKAVIHRQRVQKADEGHIHHICQRADA